MNDLLPKLRPGLALIPMAGAVQLRAGDEEILALRIEAPDVARAVLERLDGCHRRQELLNEIGEQHAGLVEALLAQLAARRLLAEEPASRGEISRYLAHFPQRQERRDLSSCRVALLGRGPALQLLKQNLTEHAIAAEPAHDLDRSNGTELVVCLWEQPDLSWVERINRIAGRQGLACLFADLSHGQHATLGPFFVPGESACYACFRQRLHENTAAYPELCAAEAHMRRTGSPLPAYGIVPTFRYLVAGLIGGEVLAFFTRHRPLRTLNRTITVDFEQLSMWSESAWRIPWCPVCGAVDDPPEPH